LAHLKDVMIAFIGMIGFDDLNLCHKYGYRHFDYTSVLLEEAGLYLFELLLSKVLITSFKSNLLLSSGAKDCFKTGKYLY